MTTPATLCTGSFIIAYASVEVNTLLFGLAIFFNGCGTNEQLVKGDRSQLEQLERKKITESDTIFMDKCLLI